jgi:UTP-glucose-1-phosphate uridylyltransferase
VVGEPEAKKLLGIHRYLLEDNINMRLRERVYECLGRIQLTEQRQKLGSQNTLVKFLDA